MTDVRAMLAIGRHGQLGLAGKLPWEGAKGPIYRQDVERFFTLTKGHVLLVGPKTFASVPGFARMDRTVVEIRSSDVPEAVVSAYPGRTIFIGGGPAVWSAYAHLIHNWDITRLPYDGEADRWFEPAWLLGGSVRFLHETTPPLQ